MTIAVIANLKRDMMRAAGEENGMTTSRQARRRRRPLAAQSARPSSASRGEQSYCPDIILQRRVDLAEKLAGDVESSHIGGQHRRRCNNRRSAPTDQRA